MNLLRLLMFLKIYLAASIVRQKSIFPFQIYQHNLYSFLKYMSFSSFNNFYDSPNRPMSQIGFGISQIKHSDFGHPKSEFLFMSQIQLGISQIRSGIYSSFRPIMSQT